jgi:hypothetical protein
MSRLNALFVPVLVLTGILIIIGDLGGALAGNNSDYATTVTPLQQTFTVIGLVGGLLLPLTFTLLHMRQADAAGGFGTVAYVLTMLFSTMLAGAFWSFAFVFPSLSSAQLDLFNNTTPAALSVGFYVTFFGLGIALLLFAIATLRAGVLSKIGAGVLIVSALLSALPFLPFGGGTLGGIALLIFAFTTSRRTVSTA